MVVIINTSDKTITVSGDASIKSLGDLMEEIIKHELDTYKLIIPEEKWKKMKK